jgi:putative FmdB family regulatory protein
MCPIFEYQCDKCKEVKEAIHKISEHPQLNCCGQQMEKVISTCGFQLKGTGWSKGENYVDHSRQTNDEQE